MSDPKYVTEFEDHAKRASVGLPESIVGNLPFGVDEELSVRRLDGGGIAVDVAPDRRDPSAVVRETGQGPRLYLDRMTVYDAGLLEGAVELVAREDALHLTPVE
ncbi:MAG: hypothetical protein ABEH47_03965 [Haloferacaceae archaeon]